MHIWTPLYLLVYLCHWCRAFCCNEHRSNNLFIANRACTSACKGYRTGSSSNACVSSSILWKRVPYSRLKRNDDQTLEEEVLLQQMEEEVLVSAQARLDMKKLQNTFLAIINTRNEAEQEKMNREDTSSSLYDPSSARLQVSRTNVALAAGFTSFLLLYLFFHNLIPSILSFLAITFVASRDPVMEEDGDGVIPSFIGPTSRLLGYYVLSFIDKVNWKLYMIGRAAVTDTNEVDSLRNQIECLEETNRKLELWIQQRQYVDDCIGNYSLDDLKTLSRKSNLSGNGSKVQLMMRLLQEGVLEIDDLD